MVEIVDESSLDALGVVRNLPASAAPAALDPVVADLQEHPEHGGIGLGGELALRLMAAGLGIDRAERIQVLELAAEPNLAELLIECVEDRTLRAVLVGERGSRTWLKCARRAADVPQMGVTRATDPLVEEHEVESVVSRADEAEAKYRSLIALVPAITYVEALDTRRTFSISPQVETILGYTPEEWLGPASRWESCLHPDDKERVVSSCTLANQRREPWSEEYRMIARDGRIVWIHDEAVLVRGSNGQPLCWQGVMVDVTAQQAAASP